MPDEHKKGFLEELQSLDEGTKQKVLIVATVVIMIVIIYFWLAYFNNIVAGVGQVAAGPAVNAAPATATATATAPASVPSAAAAAGPSIWQQMGGGLAAIGQFFINLAHGVRNVFQTPGQYTVNP
ncbi:MAG TPA: hypothetical protein VHZ04_02920 [Candidatus Paceibacterota bacterium]|jgi:hypothetical protein|nr:hypothetical protein [Candidatus Paceibacterota bacterium]